MFTGLIQDIGTIETIQKDGDWLITIQTALNMDDVDMGASIACNGCCLTVIEKGYNWFNVQVSGESLDKTNIGNWEQGNRVNLERSLKMGDELGGHFVFGHVDGLATLSNIEEEGDSYRLTLTPLKHVMQFIASKGSISLDGISLTVNEVDENSFGVNIIPHTWDHTTLADRAVGDELNIEIDMLARYVAKQMGKGVSL